MENKVKVKEMVSTIIGIIGRVFEYFHDLEFKTVMNRKCCEWIEM